MALMWGGTIFRERAILPFFIFDDVTFLLKHVFFAFPLRIEYLKSKKLMERSNIMEMELAKVTSKGQVTIPVSIRKKLHLEAGGKAEK